MGCVPWHRRHSASGAAPSPLEPELDQDVEGNYSMSHWFSFSIDADGEVTECTYPHGEPAEVVDLKKEMAVAISATIRPAVLPAGALKLAHVLPTWARI